MAGNTAFVFIMSSYRTIKLHSDSADSSTSRYVRAAFVQRSLKQILEIPNWSNCRGCFLQNEHGAKAKTLSSFADLSEVYITQFTRLIKKISLAVSCFLCLGLLSPSKQISVCGSEIFLYVAILSLASTPVPVARSFFQWVPYCFELSCLRDSTATIIVYVAYFFIQSPSQTSIRPCKESKHTMIPTWIHTMCAFLHGILSIHFKLSHDENFQ